MSSIDTRVVEAKFKNDQFGKGVNDTISSLDRLKAGLKLEGASKGLDDVSAHASKFSLAGIASGVDAIASKFSMMSMVGITALTNITNRAVNAGITLAKSLTVSPIEAGLQSYNDQINATQVIIANTKSQGATLKDVTATLAELQTYANQTVYSFSDMTSNIGRFTAAGVALKPATDSIKGMANVAALSGANAEQMSGAMYQMSQALSTGTIRLQDWNSLSNANMAGSNVQKALMETARTMGDNGKAMDAAIKKQGNFRESLSKGWLTTDIFSKTMGVMAGTVDKASGKMRAFTVEELKAKGYSDAAAKSLQQLSQDALNSAIKIRTLPQMMQALKEEVATAWGSVFKNVFGDINQATDLFTSLHTIAENALTAPVYALNDLLTAFNKLGGRTVVIDSLKLVFQALGAVITPIKAAFRDIFPKQTAKGLYDAAVAFHVFVEDLKPMPATVDNIRRTFDGFFAVLHIGWTIIKGAAKFLFDMFAGVEEGDKGILKTTASIGDFLVGLDKAVTAGGGVTKFFNTLKDLLFIIINPLKNLGQTIGNAFAGLGDVTIYGGQLGVFISSLLSFGAAADGTAKKTSSAADTIKAVFGGLIGIASKFAGYVKTFATNVAKAFGNINFDDLMAGLQTLDFAAISAGLMGVTKALKGFNIFGGKGGPGGIFHGIKESLEGLNGTLKSMQNDNNASALLKLAGAIALLALAVMLLASIDPKALTAASVAMAVLFVELTKGMAMFNNAIGMKGAAKLPLLVISLMGLAVAILLLVVAIKILTAMDWKGLAKGLFGLGAILGMLSASVKIMAENNKRMLSTGAGLLLLAVAINVLVFAVKQIADMDWASLAQGLTGVAILLGSLALFTRFAKGGPQAAAQGVGIALLAGAIWVLSKAVQEFAKLSWKDMIRGMAGMDLALASIIIAMKGVGGDPKTLLAAFALTRVAASMSVVADVFQKMAQLSWSELIRGMMAFAVSFGMVILAIKAVEKVNFTQLAGLSMVTSALEQMANALKTMGEMSTDQIVHGLIGLVGAIGVLTIALMVLSKVPQEAGFALGVVAASMALLAPALATMAAIPMAGIVGALVLLAGTLTIVGVAASLMAGSVPVLIGLGLAIGLLGVAVALAGAGVLAFAIGFTMLGAAAAAGTAGVVAAISAVIGLIPMFLTQVGLGLVALAKVIATAAPAFIGAMTAVLGALLQSVINVMPKLAVLIMNLITLILLIINKAVPMMIDTGIHLLLAFLTGIANNIGKVVDLAARIIREFLGGIARNMGSIVTKAVDVIVAFVNGIANNIGRVIQAGVNLIIKFINGMGDAARNNGKAMGDAGWNLASGIVEGMVSGLKALVGHAVDAAVKMAKAVWNGVKDFLGINSPSRLFIQIGKFVVEGFAQGLIGNSQQIGDAITSMMDKVKAAIEDSKGKIDDANKSITDLTATRAKHIRDLAAANKRLQDAYHMDTRGVGKTAAQRTASHNAKLKQQASAIDSAKRSIADLTAARQKDDRAILEQQIIRNQATIENKKETAALADLTKFAKTSEDALLNLGDQHEVLSQKLEDANKVLADATKTRDDYAKSLEDQYGAEAAISKDTKLSDYTKNLQQQIVDTQNFTIAIQELRKQGLSDEVYKKLLGTGLDAMPFIQQLLEGGQSAVDDINNLNQSLDDAAGNLGTGASTALYQAGVDAAQGIVDGLQSQQAAIEAQMHAIADALVNALKQKLDIHSPSRVLAQLGSYTAQGFAEGLKASSASVSSSADGMGQTVLDSMKKTISGLGSLIGMDTELNPVITPVLDLSMIQKDASGIGSLLATQPLSVDGSYSKATNASAGYDANLKAFAEATFAQAQPPITFIQNNNSPKALSSAEIYRQTNNQISVAKGALTSNAS